MNKRIGERTVLFSNPVYITGFGSAAGQKEKQGPLGNLFDFVSEDDFLGKKTYEMAETELVCKALNSAIEKSKLSNGEIDVILGGDLLNQCTATSYCVRDLGVSFLGLFNACATMAEAILTGAMVIDGGYAQNAAAVASSHFCTAERQFRFPLEYGGQRPPEAQWTVTASGAVILSEKGNQGFPKITKGVIGKIVDLQVTNANNMGAAMAPAFFDTLNCFLKDTKTSPKDYDLIVSGDLGKVGSDLARALFEKEGIDLAESYTDCGLMIFEREKQDVHSGGSGAGCSASVLCAKILPEMVKKEKRRVLFCGTGALMSPTLLLQKESIAGICHLVEIEI